VHASVHALRAPAALSFVGMPVDARVDQKAQNQMIFLLQNFFDKVRQRTVARRK
jgi:hypothetical protein